MSVYIIQMFTYVFFVLSTVGCARVSNNYYTRYIPCLDYKVKGIVEKIALENLDSSKNYYYIFGENKRYLLYIEDEIIVEGGYDGYYGEVVSENLLKKIKLDYPLQQNKDLLKYVVESIDDITVYDVELLVAYHLENGRLNIWDTVNKRFLKKYDFIYSSKVDGREYCAGEDDPIYFIFDSIE